MANGNRTIELYIFAGGGTGGHLYPGLAVAEELRRLRPKARIVFACSLRPIDRRILDPLPYAVVPQPVRPLPRGMGGWWSFIRAWFQSGALAGDMVRDLKPAAVLGLGGFAAGPVVREAARRGVRTALLNPDAVPGKANRYLARRAEVVFTQFASTKDCFPAGIRCKVRHVGCPIRECFARFGESSAHGARSAGVGCSEARSALRAEAIAQFGLRADRKTLVVLGGSLGAATINGAIAALGADLDELADQWQVLHIAGPGSGQRPGEVQAEKRTWMGETAGAEHARILVRPLEYCDRMDLAYAAADLSLGRAGAGTVAELAASSTPAVLMPYPYHLDRQQQLNAAGLAEAGAAAICDDAIDPQANAARLREVLIPLMKDPAKLGTMRQAASGFANPQAAKQVAAWLAG